MSRWDQLVQSWKPLAALLLVVVAGWWWIRDPPVTVGADPSPQARMVILLHGHGASKTDLEPLAEELAKASPRLGFVLPNAPHRVGLTGRTWYPPFSADSQEEMQIQLAELRAEARAVVAEIIDDLEGEGVPAKEIYVAGFSAGAVVAIDVILNPEGADLGGLVAMSGGGMQMDLGPLADRAPLRAYVSHGNGDGVVGAGQSSALADALDEHGHDVTFNLFDGAHAIPPSVRNDLAEFLR